MNEDLKVIYIPGDGLAFVKFIKEKGVGDKAHLIVVDGNFRWKIVEDGEEYIANPWELNPDK